MGGERVCAMNFDVNQSHPKKTALSEKHLLPPGSGMGRKSDEMTGLSCVEALHTRYPG